MVSFHESLGSWSPVFSHGFIFADLSVLKFFSTKPGVGVPLFAQAPRLFVSHLGKSFFFFKVDRQTHLRRSNDGLVLSHTEPVRIGHGGWGWCARRSCRG